MLHRNSVGLHVIYWLTVVHGFFWITLTDFWECYKCPKSLNSFLTDQALLPNYILQAGNERMGN